MWCCDSCKKIYLNPSVSPGIRSGDGFGYICVCGRVLHAIFDEDDMFDNDKEKQLIDKINELKEENDRLNLAFAEARETIKKFEEMLKEVEG